jgi:hypothetical protein
MRYFLFYLTCCIFFIFFISTGDAAHFITGIVHNASDGKNANGKEVVLWNPANGINDNITDVIGVGGNSGAGNIYLMDCELLNTSCLIGDEIRVQVLDSGDGYDSDYVNISVTGAGFDVMPNITMNTPNTAPTVETVFVDDSISVPSGEIDLTPAANTTVWCEGVVSDPEGNATISNVTAEFFDNTFSFYGDNNDNNDHFYNDTCSLDLGYGTSNQGYYNCSFSVKYYSNPGQWNCTVLGTDNESLSSIGSNVSNINTLLALGLPDLIDYGEVNATDVSDEKIANVTNYGNVEINLSLSGYGSVIGDGQAMNCSLGEVQNISIEYERFNLTSSNPGVLDYNDFSFNYTNLTTEVRTYELNLQHRQNDTILGVDAINQTYWRIYVPERVAGNCSGNIVFGAVQVPAS